MIRMTTPMPILTGQYLRGGHLQLLEVVGNGAFGTVYRALDVGSLELEQPIYYAVKVQYKSPRMSAQAALNNREFTTHLAVSDHPNVLSVYDIICDDKFIYVVLAWCPGGDLFSAIMERHLYHKDVELVRSVFIQLIDALHHCHEKSVYHRDLKPENILASRDGATLYIADFGLATTKPSTKDIRCGSSLYMSPGSLHPLRYCI
jgi:serine/threonine protein kinase